MITGFSVAYHYVKNFKKARRWYQDKLGLVPDYGSEEMGWQEFKVGNSSTTISICKFPKGRKTAPRKQATIVFLCDDIKRTVEELKQKKVKFMGAIVDEGPVWIATFSDPSGNVMQLAQVKPES